MFLNKENKTKNMKGKNMNQKNEVYINQQKQIVDKVIQMCIDNSFTNTELVKAFDTSETNFWYYKSGKYYTFTITTFISLIKAIYVDKKNEELTRKVLKTIFNNPSLDKVIEILMEIVLPKVDFEKLLEEENKNPGIITYKIISYLIETLNQSGATYYLNYSPSNVAKIKNRETKKISLDNIVFCLTKLVSENKMSIVTDLLKVIFGTK